MKISDGPERLPKRSILPPETDKGFSGPEEGSGIDEKNNHTLADGGQWDQRGATQSGWTPAAADPTPRDADNLAAL